MSKMELLRDGTPLESNAMFHAIKVQVSPAEPKSSAESTDKCFVICCIPYFHCVVRS